MCAQIRLVPFLNSIVCMNTYRGVLSPRETVESLRIHQVAKCRSIFGVLSLFRVCGRPCIYTSIIASFLAERSVA